MKNKITAILLFFAFSFAATGLMAQVPGPVHGTKTDREVQQEDDNTSDRTYKQEENEVQEGRHQGRKDKARKEKSKRKGKQAKASCSGEENQDAYRKEGRGKRGNIGKVKQETKVRKGKMNKEKKYFKKHPIFERRADARNGKGEKND